MSYQRRGLGTFISLHDDDSKQRPFEVWRCKHYFQKHPVVVHNNRVYLI